MTDESSGYGVGSMVTPLKAAIVKSPEEAFIPDEDWQALGWSGAPDLDVAAEEHARLRACLEMAEVDVLRLPRDDRTGADSIYTQDPALVTPHGVVTLHPGKPARAGESPAMADCLMAADIPVIGSLRGAETAEGGDTLWLDPRTLIVGRGFRTSSEGINRLRDILEPHGVDVLAVDLPVWHGPDACFHLTSVISMVDHDIALVHRPLLPVALYQALRSRGVTMIHVEESEWPTHACNVLALAPRHLVMVEGNPKTQARLEEADCRVYTYPGAEITQKGCGGPTCLVRALRRA